MVSSGFTAADPFPGGMSTVTVRGSPSGSESLASTLMVTGTPLLVAAESFTATGGRSTGVTSCPVLFDSAGSKVGEDTVAWLVTWGTAPAPTLTVTGKLVDAPEASALGFVQVTACPAAAQVQPLPLPETKASPAGSESVTESDPAASSGPAFDTEIV